MECNKMGILIILIIIIICSLIIISYKKHEYFEIPDTNIAGLEDTSKIDNNNKKINYLINQLKSINPSVIIKNYNPEIIYNELETSLNSNISNINNILISLYDKNNVKNNRNIEELENKIIDLENIITNLNYLVTSNKKYDKIKSLNNGMELQLVSSDNTKYKDSKNDNILNGYMVMANNGCLSVGANDYDIYKCDDKNKKQLFKMEHILNETAYQNSIDTTLPIDNTNKENINYPFILMKSLNNENCLTNNNGNLTVQPCYTFTSQRWFPI